MRLRCIALAVSLLAVACDGKSKEASRAAAAKSANEAQIDERAKVIAQDLIRRAQDDADKTRETAEQQKTDERKRLHQAAVDHPGDLLESSSLQVADDGRHRLTSVLLTNKSQFSMSEIRGTVDFHGGAGDGGADSEIMAQVPVQLTGAIVPGASMVFSEAQRTIAGAAIRLPRAPLEIRFTVTSAKVGSEGLDSSPVSVGTDAGHPGGAAP
jgi:hypothetical protein